MRVSFPYHIDWISLLAFASLTFSTTYTTTVNNNGATVIESVRTISADGNTNSTIVDLRDYDYAYLDGRRTIATDYSCRVGVETTDANGNKNVSYYIREYYVEFYVSGGGRVYD